MADSQIAVLIDFENVGLSHIQWLFDQVSDIGRVTVKRAYADWSTGRDQRDQLLELGIEAVHLFHSVRSGKNASDLRLAIDAIDLLYQSTVDTFVIVSADSDFVPLVSRLRTAGKVVIGAGPQATAPRTLVIACDRFLYMGQDRDVQTTGITIQTQQTDDLLSRAVGASVDDQGIVVGSKLHQTIQRLDPSFNFRAQGYSTFTEYLEASRQVSVKRPRGPGDVLVEFVDYGNSQAVGATDPQVWGPKIDATWRTRAKKSGEFIAGPTAAADAAAMLGVHKLSASQYKTLQSLFDACPTLNGEWLREGNKVIRR